MKKQPPAYFRFHVGGEVVHSSKQREPFGVEVVAATVQQAQEFAIYAVRQKYGEQVAIGYNPPVAIAPAQDVIIIEDMVVIADKEGHEIIAWHEQEFKDDVSAVWALVHAINIYYQQGAAYLKQYVEHFSHSEKLN